MVSFNYNVGAISSFLYAESLEKQTYKIYHTKLDKLCIGNMNLCIGNMNLCIGNMNL